GSPSDTVRGPPDRLELAPLAFAVRERHLILPLDRLALLDLLEVDLHPGQRRPLPRTRNPLSMPLSRLPSLQTHALLRQIKGPGVDPDGHVRSDGLPALHRLLGQEQLYRSPVPGRDGLVDGTVSKPARTERLVTLRRSGLPVAAHD